MSLKTALRAALAAAALAATAASPSGASVQVGASGWQWGNPLPQGNTVRTMAFSGSTGYAAGDFGTLLKTTDGGSSWSGLPVGTFAGLSIVQALDADTVFAGGGCVARRSTDGGRTFTAVRFSSVEIGCRVPLRDLSFVSRDVGYLLLEDGSVLATTDGGTRFSARTAVPETRKAGGPLGGRAITFLDADKGFAASGGKIFRTVNGGRSWSGVEGDFGPTINRLTFLDATNGFAVSQRGRLLRTYDGGARWMSRATAGEEHDLTSIRCNTSLFCVMTTAAGTELIRVDRGGEGVTHAIKPSTDPVYAAAFASPTRVAAAGANGASVVSDDAGETFTTLGGRLGGTFGALRAGGEANAAFASGADGVLARTTDGGRTWSTNEVPGAADLVDVAFPTNAIGYALDRDGGLFRTDDDGGSWKPLGTGSTRRPRALLSPDENAVLVVGPVGMRRSGDAGETFSQVRSRAVVGTRLDGAVARGETLLAWGPTALLRSANRGASWSAVPTPGRSARERRALRIAQAAFASVRVGVVLDTDGRVWRTADGGRRWTLLTATGTEDVLGLAAVSARAMYLVVPRLGERPGGWLLRSGDAGATWAPQLVVDAPIRGAGIASASGVDYLLAGDANLLFSTTGGLVGDPSELTLATKRRQLTRGGRITVTGRLAPAAAGADVTVSAQVPGGTQWRHQVVRVASNGTFATSWQVLRGTTTFVAQWAGDVASAGAGSRSLTVTVAPGGRARRR